MSFYRHDVPAVGATFVGRESLMRGLLEGLQRDRSFAVIGGPKTGRSSVLAELVRLAQERSQRQPKAPKVVPVLVRLGAIGNARTLPGLLWDLLGAALAQPGVMGKDPRPSVASGRQVWQRAPDPWKKLAELREELWAKLRGTSTWCRWCLLVDDADLLFDRGFAGLPEQLTALAQEKSDAAPACLVLAGGRALREHLLDARATLSFVRPLLLGAFRLDEAAQLVHVGFRDLDDTWVNNLAQASGRHPWVLTRLLWELEHTGLELGAEGAVNAATDDVLRLFETIWDVLDGGRGVTYRGAYAAPEHALMQLVLDFASGVTLDTAERELGIKPLREYAELLEYLGLLERVLKGHAHQLRPHFDMWNVWYGERIMR